MKYDREGLETKAEDSIGVVANFIVHIMLAPLNLTRNISSNILFLGKESLQKLSTVAMVIQGIFIGNDILKIFRNKTLSIWEGNPPLIVKLLTLVVSIWLINYFIKLSESMTSSDYILQGVEYEEEVSGFTEEFDENDLVDLNTEGLLDDLDPVEGINISEDDIDLLMRGQESTDPYTIQPLKGRDMFRRIEGDPITLDLEQGDQEEERRKKEEEEDFAYKFMRELESLD